MNAHIANHREPLCGETAIGHRIADGLLSDAEQSRQLGTTDSVTDVLNRRHEPPIIQKIWTDKVHVVADHKKWTGSYADRMEPDRRDRLARTGDTGLEAVAIRLRAARKFAGLEQKDVERETGVKKTSISNAENGLNYPGVPLMRYYYRMHRLDFNFVMNGDWSQLPSSTHQALFVALEAANDEWGRTPRSSPRRAAREASQEAT